MADTSSRVGIANARLLAIALSILVVLPGCVSQRPDADATAASLAALLDEIYEWNENRLPISAVYRGELPINMKAPSAAGFAGDANRAQSYIERLDQAAAAATTAQRKLDLAVVRFHLSDLIARERYGAHFVPLDAEWGFYSLLSVLQRRLRVTKEEDYRQLVAWLPKYADWLLAHIELLREGARRGITPPKLVVENNIAMLAPLAQAPFDAHADFVLLRSATARLDASVYEALNRTAKEVFQTRIRPAYEELYEYLRASYLAAAQVQPGVQARTAGREFYNNRVRFFTTLELSPNEVFALGESEVRRITAQMRGVQSEHGFEGTMREYIAHLRTLPAYYPKTPQALLERAAWIAKRIEGKLPQYFSPLYRLPFTIEPVPAAIAKSYTSGRYLSGNAARSRPGIYWVNTTALSSRALYNLPALTLHESVPGHHLQHARAAESDHAHPFRSEYYISAFGEGWGLYAEYLGKEMGIYQTPEEHFGRLSYEMWRACRLVVDVGIHHKGWTRARAIGYLSARTALSELEVRNEIDRYIGWPGQALAYKIGELVIKGLREEAQQQLGDHFDIKAFHEAVLGNGSLPLDLLIEEVRGRPGLQQGGLPQLLGRGIADAKAARSDDAISK